MSLQYYDATMDLEMWSKSHTDRIFHVLINMHMQEQSENSKFGDDYDQLLYQYIDVYNRRIH